VVVAVEYSAWHIRELFAWSVRRRFLGAGLLTRHIEDAFSDDTGRHTFIGDRGGSARRHPA
jgi:hypothetical protein